MKKERNYVGFQARLSKFTFDFLLCRSRTLILSGVLTLILFFPAAAQYTLQDDDVVVTDGIIESCSYDFEIKDIIIPDTLDGQAVRKFTGKYAYGLFGRNGIQSVRLPATLQTIGRFVFYQNDLTRIDFRFIP